MENGRSMWRALCAPLAHTGAPFPFLAAADGPLQRVAGASACVGVLRAFAFAITHVGMAWSTAARFGSTRPFSNAVAFCTAWRITRREPTRPLAKKGSCSSTLTARGKPRGGVGEEERAPSSAGEAMAHASARRRGERSVVSDDQR